MKRIKLTLLILSIISAAYTTAPGLGALSFVFIIPLVYGVSYYLLVPNKLLLGPGLTMINFVLFIRYIIFPPIFKYYGFQMDSLNCNKYVPLAIYISVVEILTILLAIKFSNIKRNSPNSPKRISKILINKRVPFTLLFIAFIAYVFNPDVFVNMHFILNPEMIIAEKIEFSSDIWVKIMEWAKIFIVLFLFSFFYSRYRSKILVVTVALFSCMFYSGHSRLSLLIPLIATMFIVAKLFPEKRKLTFITFGSFALFAFISLTIVKTFKVENINDLTIINLDQLLNAYFGGIPNVLTGLYAKDIFANKIGIGTMLNDMFRNGMGFNSFFQSDNNSVYYFNDIFPGDGFDQIIPTCCQGVFYFGYFFFWITTLVMVKFVLYSDKIYFTSSKLEYVWISSAFSVAVGFAIPGSFQHLYINLHSMLPLLFLVLINRLNIKIFLHKIVIPSMAMVFEKINKISGRKNQIFITRNPPNLI